MSLSHSKPVYPATQLHEKPEPEVRQVPRLEHGLEAQAVLAAKALPHVTPVKPEVQLHVNVSPAPPLHDPPLLHGLEVQAVLAAKTLPHVVPVKPVAQVHVYPFTTLLHDPPLEHGLDKHSFTSLWH